MSDNTSPLDAARAAYEPRVPEALGPGIGDVSFEEGAPYAALADEREIAERFPRTYGRPALNLAPDRRGSCAGSLTVGVVLSGGQAPGGHNVITGLFDGLQAIHPGSRVLGFLGGPRGIVEGHHRELTADALGPYRNAGGFDLIGSGRDKIETTDQLAASRATGESLGLDAMVIVGGDDSNTNAAVLAEYFLEAGADMSVIGVPKTIDGDLKGSGVEISFGFDSATKTYSELVGNICRDARSAGKYWHFIKLMGRSASHVTLECALQTHANVALIGEEVEERELTLDRVVEQVASVVRRRAEAGRHHGVCLVPEGLIEFIPEMRALIAELNRVLAEDRTSFEAIESTAEKGRFVQTKLSEGARRTFAGLPPRIQAQLLLDRDSHGNVQVSRIDTEQLLIEQVGAKIEAWREAGEFPGKFQVQGHFFGYEGRCAAPGNFDADYTYALGRLAAALAAARKTGYMCGIANLAAPPAEWRAAAIPLTAMMRMETRKGRRAPVIGKALVRTDAEPFLTFKAHRDHWATEDAYRYPGAIQYFGPTEIADAISETLRLESRNDP